MVGHTYGILTVVEEMQNDKGGKRFLCRCQCGGLKVAYRHHLLQGGIKSCGCLKTRHGNARANGRTKEFIIWTGMKQRCLNPKDRSYARYGGRGITVCERWLDFANFLSDMGKCPDGRSLERINNNGNYEPANCKWATLSEQQRNRRNTVHYTVGDITDTFVGWAHRLGLPKSTLGGLLNRYDMTEIWRRKANGEIISSPQKLCAEDAIRIYLSGEPTQKLSKEYGVSPANITNIKAKRVWGKTIERYLTSSSESKTFER